MRRSLERRLRVVETRWFGITRVAAILRAIEAALNRGTEGDLLAGMGGIETLSDRELDFLIGVMKSMLSGLEGAAHTPPRA
jgi:hypothetical protein